MGVKVAELFEFDTTTHRAWMVWCPACHHAHSFDSRWTYNGNASSPTFDGSMISRGVAVDESTGQRVPTVCHSFLVDGRWQYLNDCTHALKGQKVEAPDWGARV
jgi:hypothetical protein